MAVPGTLGTLQPEGRACAAFAQSGFQHSRGSSAGDQTHSSLSTEIKSPSTEVIAVKGSVMFLQNFITGKPPQSLALAKASLEVCHLGLEQQCTKVKVCNRYMCKELQSPTVPFSQRSQSHSLSAVTHAQTCTRRQCWCTRETKYWSNTSQKSRKSFLVTSARSACKSVSWEPAKKSCGRGSSPLVSDRRWLREDS